MTDRPIPFCAPMVRALRAGRKTQTRRVLGKTGGEVNIFSPAVRWSDSYVLDPGNAEWRARYTPYAPGDRLWVGEEHYALGHWVPDGLTKTGKPKWRFVRDGETIWFDPPREFRVSMDKERPQLAQWYRRLGRFMFRKASRITLTVTEVRVQRLQEISEEDARAEGVTRCAWAEAMAGDGRIEWHVPKVKPGEYPGLTNAYPSPIGPFIELWDSLHGPDAWHENPWVVAVSFTVEKKNIDT